MGEAEKSVDYTLIVQAAAASGDPWLCADSTAVLLGMFTPEGAPNRRGFLEGPAKRTSFPAPLLIGNQKKWRKSEVVLWTEDERRIQQKAA